jgi:PIN domain nuclease of toxin-antitoxin system
MNLLLDTHIFLWYVSGNPRLSSEIMDEISDSSNTVYVSVVSVWEAVIKHSLGKLPLPAGPSEYLPRRREAHGFSSLSVDEGAMTHLARLPSIHGDPFDRLLIAQALQHGLTLVTADEQLRAYPVTTLGVLSKQP